MKVLNNFLILAIVAATALSLLSTSTQTAHASPRSVDCVPYLTAKDNWGILLPLRDTVNFVKSAFEPEVSNTYTDSNRSNMMLAMINEPAENQYNDCESLRGRLIEQGALPPIPIIGSIVNGALALLLALSVWLIYKHVHSK